ncbi:MAG: outer membrane lipoprotein-sorting protein [Desulfobulbaceae bacterium]|nr:outer membrane lipoprotein-sorting protein [Desulfobulbaceae bacterium]
MKTRFLTLLIPLALLLLSTTAVSAAPPVEEIVDKANKASYYAGNDGKSDVTMTITDAQERTRNREFVILRLDATDGGDQKFYVYFKKPSDVRKTVFMVHKFIDKDDDRWMYLPALDLVKRIAASDKRTSFMGSHFFYEDVSGRTVTEDNHELIDETDKFFVLKNTPKSPDTVEFASYTLWIDKTNFLPVKAEYINKAGQKYRVVEALETKDIQGHPTVTKSRVEDLESGGNTVTEFHDVAYDIGLDDSIFTERYLRRPPREARR